jgi:hypothetical protein
MYNTTSIIKALEFVNSFYALYKQQQQMTYIKLAAELYLEKRYHFS